MAIMIEKFIFGLTSNSHRAILHIILLGIIWNSKEAIQKEKEKK